MAALDRSSLPDQVFRGLCADVVGGRYAPGDRLPAQRAMAAEMGVNMASVREGIKRLEQLRLVDVRHGDAMRVRDWRSEGGLDVLAHATAGAPDLEREALGALFEARRLLLSEAARLAAGRRTDAQAATLEALAAELAAAGSDAAAQVADLAFFSTVITAAGNLVLSLIMNSVREVYAERFERFRPIVSGREELAPLYARAARAIADSDGETAATVVGRLAAAQESRMTAASG